METSTFFFLLHEATVRNPHLAIRAFNVPLFFGVLCFKNSLRQIFRSHEKLMKKISWDVKRIKDFFSSVETRAQVSKASKGKALPRKKASLEEKKSFRLWSDWAVIWTFKWLPSDNWISFFPTDFPPWTFLMNKKGDGEEKFNWKLIRLPQDYVPNDMFSWNF